MSLLAAIHTAYDELPLARTIPINKGILNRKIRVHFVDRALSMTEVTG